MTLDEFFKKGTHFDEIKFQDGSEVKDIIFQKYERKFPSISITLTKKNYPFKIQHCILTIDYVIREGIKYKIVPEYEEWWLNDIIVIEELSEEKKKEIPILNKLGKKLLILNDAIEDVLKEIRFPK